MDENKESSDQVNEEPQQQQQQQEVQSETVLDVSQNSKNMAMLCHLLGLLTCFIGPLIIWLLKKDEDAFIDSQGKEALNFQLSVTIASIVGGLLTFMCIGMIILPVVGILDIVFSIIACVKSSQGIDYKYPISIRLIK